MPSHRLLPLLVLPCLTVLLAGALTLPEAVPARATAPPPVFPLRADPAAGATLERAMAALAADRVPWVKTQLWQQVHVPALPMQAEGTYVVGPDHRLRLDLQVRTGDMAGRLLIVSDGRTLWQAEQHGTGERSVSRAEIRKVLEALQTPEGAGGVGGEFFHSQLFAGLTPLLENLRQDVTFTRQDAVRWRDRDVLLLTGVWSKQPEGSRWPDHFPRQCRLFLDKESMWPHRLEWWGPMARRKGDVLLSQLEFRDPVLGQPMADQEFAFSPGKSRVTDLTAHGK